MFYAYLIVIDSVSNVGKLINRRTREYFDRQFI